MASKPPPRRPELLATPETAPDKDPSAKAAGGGDPEAPAGLREVRRGGKSQCSVPSQVRCPQPQPGGRGSLQHTHVSKFPPRRQEGSQRAEGCWEGTSFSSCSSPGRAPRPPPRRRWNSRCWRQVQAARATSASPANTELHIPSSGPAPSPPPPGAAQRASIPGHRHQPDSSTGGGPHADVWGSEAAVCDAVMMDPSITRCPNPLDAPHKREPQCKQWSA